MDDHKLQVNKHYITHIRFNFHFQGQMGDESRFVVPFNKVKFYVKRPENKRKQNFKMETKWKQDGHDVSKERSKYKDKIGKKVLVLENGICGTVKYLGHLIADGKLFCGIETVIFILIFSTLYYRTHMRLYHLKFLRTGKFFQNLKVLFLLSITQRLDFSLLKISLH